MILSLIPESFNLQQKSPLDKEQFCSDIRNEHSLVKKTSKHRNDSENTVCTPRFLHIEAESRERRALTKKTEFKSSRQTAGKEGVAASQALNPRTKLGPCRGTASMLLQQTDRPSCFFCESPDHNIELCEAKMALTEKRKI